MSNIVASELERALAKLVQVDQTTEDYWALLRNIEYLTYHVDMFEDVEQYLGHGIVKVEVRLPEEETGEGDEAYPLDNVSPFPAEGTFLGTKAATESQEEPVHEPVEEEPAKVYEMTEVRAALVEARKKGTNVTELLKEFGVENFGAFPAGRYGELMKRLGVE